MGQPIGPTVRAVAGVLDGRIIGVGGVAFFKGWAVAFCDLEDDALRHPVTLHKAARQVVRWMQESGRRFVFAEADPDYPRSRQWLTRLGFQPYDDDRTMVWRA